MEWTQDDILQICTKADMAAQAINAKPPTIGAITAKRTKDRRHYLCGKLHNYPGPMRCDCKLEYAECGKCGGNQDTVCHEECVARYGLDKASRPAKKLKEKQAAETSKNGVAVADIPKLTEAAPVAEAQGAQGSGGVTAIQVSDSVPRVCSVMPVCKGQSFGC